MKRILNKNMLSTVFFLIAPSYAMENELKNWKSLDSNNELQTIEEQSTGQFCMDISNKAQERVTQLFSNATEKQYDHLWNTIVNVEKFFKDANSQKCRINLKDYFKFAIMGNKIMSTAKNFSGCAFKKDSLKDMEGHFDTLQQIEDKNVSNVASKFYMMHKDRYEEILYIAQLLWDKWSSESEQKMKKMDQQLPEDRKLSLELIAQHVLFLNISFHVGCRTNLIRDNQTGMTYLVHLFQNPLEAKELVPDQVVADLTVNVEIKRDGKLIGHAVYFLGLQGMVSGVSYEKGYSVTVNKYRPEPQRTIVEKTTTEEYTEWEDNMKLSNFLFTDEFFKAKTESLEQEYESFQKILSETPLIRGAYISVISIMGSKNYSTSTLTNTEDIDNGRIYGRLITRDAGAPKEPLTTMLDPKTGEQDQNIIDQYNALNVPGGISPVLCDGLSYISIWNEPYEMTVGNLEKGWEQQYRLDLQSNISKKNQYNHKKIVDIRPSLYKHHADIAIDTSSNMKKLAGAMLRFSHTSVMQSFMSKENTFYTKVAFHDDGKVDYEFLAQGGKLFECEETVDIEQ